MWKNQSRAEYVDGVPSDLRANFTDFDVIGSGTYGTVYRADPKIGGPLVALKKIKLHTNERVISMSLPATAMREILILKELSHPNVVTLRDVYFKPVGLSLWLWFDHCPLDLRVLVKWVHRAQCSIADQSKQFWPGGLDILLVSRFSHQLFNGLAFVHKMNIIHRDLKPQNILMHDAISSRKNLENRTSMNPPQYTPSSELRKALTCFPDIGPICSQVLCDAINIVAQIADFGLSRSGKIYFQHLTHEVVTLWYRAPEILLGCERYTNSIDVWSLGCIIAEMISGRPLFAGDSEIDTLFKIFKILGTPENPEQLGYQTLNHFQKVFPRWKVDCIHTSLSNAIFKVDRAPYPLLIDLIACCLRVNAKDRITCAQALTHPFFTH